MRFEINIEGTQIGRFKGHEIEYFAIQHQHITFAFINKRLIGIGRGIDNR